MRREISMQYRTFVMSENFLLLRWIKILTFWRQKPTVQSLWKIVHMQLEIIIWLLFWVCLHAFHVDLTCTKPTYILRREKPELLHGGPSVALKNNKYMRTDHHELFVRFFYLCQRPEIWKRNTPADCVQLMRKNILVRNVYPRLHSGDVCFSWVHMNSILRSCRSVAKRVLDWKKD